jgi:hypothetical protein
MTRTIAAKTNDGSHRSNDRIRTVSRPDVEFASPEGDGARLLCQVDNDDNLILLRQDEKKIWACGKEVSNANDSTTTIHHEVSLRGILIRSGLYIPRRTVRR